MWYTKEPNKFFQQDSFLIPSEPMTILPDLSDLVIEQVSITNEVTVTVRAASPTAPCPCCGTISKRVQSRYTRTLRDLPASGRLVHLIVDVRRFFCQERTCVRKIFAERFPSLTLPRVKFTLRLQEALRQMGFALGGEAGARLGRQLSIPGSSDTLLRLVKQTELPVASSPQVVGIDDWSWKRRLRYGTLICDLENNTPIDVLPDREVETVSARAREPSHGGNCEPRSFFRVRSRNFERGSPGASSRRCLAYLKEFSRQCLNAVSSLSGRNPTWLARTGDARASRGRTRTRRRKAPSSLSQRGTGSCRSTRAKVGPIHTNH